MRMQLLTSGLCLLALCAPVLAQGPGKAAPPTHQEIVEKKKAMHLQMAQCTRKAKQGGVQPGTPQFDRFMTDCLRGR